jgi:hypothetical protein
MIPHLVAITLTVIGAVGVFRHELAERRGRS